MAEALKGQLATAEAAKAYLLAGRGTVTLRSRRTGTRFTYKLNRKADGSDLYYVSLLQGPDNLKDYWFIGSFTSGSAYKHAYKARLRSHATGVQAFSWAWGHLRKGVLPAEVEVWHEGRCGRCGRKLTVPESIERGLGPECATITER